MSIYIDHDEFDLSSNEVFLDVWFVVPGYRKDGRISSFDNETQIFSKLYNPLLSVISKLSKEVGCLSLDDLDYIKPILLINPYNSDECEYKVHIYFRTKHEPIAKGLINLLKDVEKRNEAFSPDQIIIDFPRLSYYYHSSDDIRITLKDDKTVELENVRKEAKEWQRKYERLLKKCQSFASDIDREV